MDARMIQPGPAPTFVLVFGDGEEIIAGRQGFAEERSDKIAIPEQVEVLMLAGNIALHEGKPKVHAHVVVGKRDGTAHGGHLLRGHVRPTLEVVLAQPARRLQRRTDPASGLLQPAPACLSRRPLQ